jgi:hypothetical protein
MRDELERFVASLAIPADRRTVVLAELLDHVACAREAAVREGRDPDAAERAAIGDTAALRRSLEAVEPAFRVTRRHAFARGVLAGVIVAIIVDMMYATMYGLVAAVLAIAIGAAIAPPRVFELLRAELRAPRLRQIAGGIPIGPALTYAFTVMSAPFVVWIGMIVVRAFRGDTYVYTPWSAFALMSAVYLVLFVEGIRARRTAMA